MNCWDAGVKWKSTNNSKTITFQWIHTQIRFKLLWAGLTYSAEKNEIQYFRNEPILMFAARKLDMWYMTNYTQHSVVLENGRLVKSQKWW